MAGGRTGTIWWRGSILPTRIGEFGVGVTRFVPGRDGRGFTDDLDQLTDAMIRERTGGAANITGGSGTTDVATTTR